MDVSMPVFIPSNVISPLPYKGNSLLNKAKFPISPKASGCHYLIIGKTKGGFHRVDDLFNDLDFPGNKGSGRGVSPLPKISCTSAFMPALQTYIASVLAFACCPF
jgi:hypothetical protein